MAKNIEKKWFLRSMFISLTRSKSKQEIEEKNKKREVTLTEEEIKTIENVFEIILTKEQISQINAILRRSRNEIIESLEEDNVDLEYSKADSVIEALEEVLNANMEEEEEDRIKDSIQQKLTTSERNRIIEKRARTTRLRTGIASLAVASFITGAASTKALTDATNTAQNKYATEATLDVDDYGENLEEVEVKGVKGDDGNFRKSLIVDGTQVDANEIGITEQIEAAVDSAMEKLTSPAAVKKYIAGIVEREYNEANHDNITVSSVDQQGQYINIYVNDEDGNEATLKYANVEGEYVRIYEEDEESKENQTLREEVVQLIQTGLIWSEEYYNENTLFTYEDGKQITMTDEDGNELTPSDLTEKEFRDALQKYKEARTLAESENDYIQDDSDEMEPGD